jgi:hypothetical protein
MKRIVATVVALTVLPLLVGGCYKPVELTITNKSETARTIQVTTPDGTMTVGQVSPGGGKLTQKIRVKNSDLPAQLQILAGSGASTSFMVTEASPAKLWFYISGTGAMAGPYGQKDVHVETEERGTVEGRTQPEMIVK